MANKINHLPPIYRQLQQHTHPAVLATIIETFGSTYQKAGVRMLISHKGELTGLLGGGCFERDLVEQAHSVFETGVAKTVFYDMRSPEDVIWGLGLGCNGAVKVLLQLLSAENDFSPLNSIAEVAESKLAGVLVTIFDSEYADFSAGQNLFLPATSTNNQQMLSSAPFPFMTAALQCLLQQKPRIESHTIKNQQFSAFYDPLQPPLHLLIFGAGADAIPVVNSAKALGWQVSVVDYRPAHIKPERFPLADQLLYAVPEKISETLELDSFNAAVLMTHNIEYDQRYLQALVHSHIPFIGLLGPAPRKDRLLHSLGNDSSQISNRVFGPVGLDIGAETPEEIALSIVAGIRAELSNRSGRPLSSKAIVDLHACIPR